MLEEKIVKAFLDEGARPRAKADKPPSDDPCIKCHYRLDKTGVGYCYKCIEMAAVEREERK